MADDRNAKSLGSGQNPYSQPPPPPPLPPGGAPVAPPPRQVAGGYLPCPRCGGVNIQKMSFTWWGGLLGPSLLCHCRCQACRTTFNGNTGKSNNTAIAIYTIVCVLLVIVVLVLGVLANS